MLSVGWGHQLLQVTADVAAACVPITNYTHTHVISTTVIANGCVLLAIMHSVTLRSNKLKAQVSP